MAAAGGHAKTDGKLLMAIVAEKKEQLFADTLKEKKRRSN
jgi:hypothetical protein